MSLALISLVEGVVQSILANKGEKVIQSTIGNFRRDKRTLLDPKLITGWRLINEALTLEVDFGTSRDFKVRHLDNGIVCLEEVSDIYLQQTGKNDSEKVPEYWFASYLLAIAYTQFPDNAGKRIAQARWSEFLSYAQGLMSTFEKYMAELDNEISVVRKLKEGTAQRYRISRGDVEGYDPAAALSEDVLTVRRIITEFNDFIELVESFIDDPNGTHRETIVTGVNGLLSPDGNICIGFGDYRIRIKS